MPLTRIYRKEVVDANRAALQEDPESLGARLGYAAIHTGVPIRMLAELLGTHDMSVYRWFRGAYPRGTHLIRKVRVLTAIMDHALEKRILPIPQRNYATIQEALNRAADSLKTERASQDKNSAATT